MSQVPNAAEFAPVKITKIPEVAEEAVTPPDVDLREVTHVDDFVYDPSDHGVDYGEIDHVLRDVKPVIFDINRTPGISGASEENQQALANALAPGILDYLF